MPGPGHYADYILKQGPEYHPPYIQGMVKTISHILPVLYFPPADPNITANHPPLGTLS